MDVLYVDAEVLGLARHRRHGWIQRLSPTSQSTVDQGESPLGGILSGVGARSYILLLEFAA